jgi:hypothetical protein
LRNKSGTILHTKHLENVDMKRGFFPLIKETTDIKQLIAKQNYNGFQESTFNRIIDELAIDEPLGKLLESIK